MIALELERDETALVAALRAGDEAAFTALVRRYHGALLRTARNFVPTAAVAEEVVQETWLGVVRGIENFRGGSSLKTWIFRILVNRARTRGERERRTTPFSALVTEEDQGGPTEDAERFTADGAWAVAPRPFQLPEERLRLLEVRAQIREALAALPVRQRMVVTLRDVEGIDADEVCRLLDLTPENQRVLLHRGRAKLAAALEPELAG